jgi:hypothetical protein
VRFAWIATDGCVLHYIKDIAMPRLAKCENSLNKIFRL